LLVSKRRPLKKCHAQSSAENPYRLTKHQFDALIRRAALLIDRGGGKEADGRNIKISTIVKFDCGLTRSPSSQGVGIARRAFIGGGGDRAKWVKWSERISLRLTHSVTYCKEPVAGLREPPASSQLTNALSLSLGKIWRRAAGVGPGYGREISPPEKRRICFCPTAAAFY
jgi:hypothetical protein